MKTYSVDQIKAALQGVDLIPLIEDRFVAYSDGRSIIPPVSELMFKDPPGEVHIKYGYVQGDEYYYIKIASGFYENEELGLPGGSGIMLLFRQKAGEMVRCGEPCADRIRHTPGFPQKESCPYGGDIQQHARLGFGVKPALGPYEYG